MRSFAPGRLSQSVAALLTLTTLAACQRWTTVESPIASTVEKNDPDHIRITTTDGRVMELRSPIVEGDSIAGTVAGEPQAMVAIAEIEKLEFRQSNAGLTLLSVAGAAAIVLAIVLATNPGDENR